MDVIAKKNTQTVTEARVHVYIKQPILVLMREGATKTIYYSI